MTRNTHRHRAHRPVFVDASGRRQRGLRVAGLILVLPAAGYIVVLLSTLLGGPTIQSPFLPSPAAPSRATVAAQHPGPQPTSVPTSGPAHIVGPTSTQLPTAPALVNVISTALPTFTSVPTSTPSATWKAKGRPTSLPTPTNRPTKPSR